MCITGYKAIRKQMQKREANKEGANVRPVQVGDKPATPRASVPMQQQQQYAPAQGVPQQSGNPAYSG